MRWDWLRNSFHRIMSHSTDNETWYDGMKNCAISLINAFPSLNLRAEVFALREGDMPPRHMISNISPWTVCGRRIAAAITLLVTADVAPPKVSAIAAMQRQILPAISAGFMVRQAQNCNSCNSAFLLVTDCWNMLAERGFFFWVGNRAISACYASFGMSIVSN